MYVTGPRQIWKRFLSFFKKRPIGQLGADPDWKDSAMLRRHCLFYFTLPAFLC